MNQKAPDDHGPNTVVGYGLNTDAGNDDDHTTMSLYSLYGDIIGDNVQIFIEAPPGIRKFGRLYRPSYVFSRPYLIPPFKRVRNVKPLHTLKIADCEIDERMSVDINLLKGLEDPRLYEKFDKWFVDIITVDRLVQQSQKNFKILSGQNYCSSFF